MSLPRTVPFNNSLDRLTDAQRGQREVRARICRAEDGWLKLCKLGLSPWPLLDFRARSAEPGSSMPGPAWQRTYGRVRSWCQETHSMRGRMISLHCSRGCFTLGSMGMFATSVVGGHTNLFRVQRVEWTAADRGERDGLLVATRTYRT
jgi:hypothetical protein